MLGDISLDPERPESNAGHSPPPSAEAEKTWIYTLTPPIRLHGVVFSEFSTKAALHLLYMELNGFSWCRICGSELSVKVGQPFLPTPQRPLLVHQSRVICSSFLPARAR
jgi:hypothetical protein